MENFYTPGVRWKILVQSLRDYVMAHLFSHLWYLWMLILGVRAEVPQLSPFHTSTTARKFGRNEIETWSRAPSSAIFNVKDYGAKGDNETDDTTAFRSALAAASSANGGDVFVPPGLFVIAGNLTVPPGVSLRGTYRAVPSHSMANKAKWQGQSLRDGSILIPTGGRGSNCTVHSVHCCTDTDRT